jgi:predicted acylesterase/phospholipase RssA
MIGVNLPQVPQNQATSPDPEEFWPPLPLLPKWMAEKLIGRWVNLLDTGPLLQTLQNKFQLDEQKIAERPATLMMTATNVQTGERAIFSNKSIYRYRDGDIELRPDVHKGISLRRIIASCSIPLVYPWTYDEKTESYYWDGALVANTPIGAALDAVRDKPPEIPMEVVVVLMTPWWDADEPAPERASQLPDSFDDAITWMLDWMLLASFRERLNMIKIYNDLADLERRAGNEELHYRKVNVAIVAPDKFFNVARIIDYDEYSADLIEYGYQAAKAEFKQQFGV